MFKIDYPKIWKHLIDPDTKFHWDGYLKQIAKIKIEGNEPKSRMSSTRNDNKSKAAETPVSELAKIILRYQDLSKLFKIALAESTKHLQEKYRQEQPCSSKKDDLEKKIVHWRAWHSMIGVLKIRQRVLKH